MILTQRTRRRTQSSTEKNKHSLFNLCETPFTTVFSVFKNLIRKGVYCFLLLIIFLYSCTKDKAAEIKKETKQTCTPHDSVSFKLDILPILNTHCNTSGCHSGTNPKGNLNLETSVAYSQLTNKRKGYIDTLNPKFSILYSQLNSSSNPMPPTGKLEDCNIAIILKWMEQKAINN